MEITQTGPEETLGLLTLGGFIIYIDRNMGEILRNKLPSNHTMAGALASDNFYAISETGQILNENEEVMGKLGSRGWGSLRQNGPRELAAGSL